VMGLVKVGAWPVVTPDNRDGGNVRCFYCKEPVGKPHEQECVRVSKLTRWRVLCDGKPVGWFNEYLPHWWGRHEMEFRMNEGSWCSDNCLDGRVEWDTVEPPELGRIAENDCSCHLLSFEFDRVVDNGPFYDEGA
jgi:hypothetical protein